MRCMKVKAERRLLVLRPFKRVFAVKRNESSDSAFIQIELQATGTTLTRHHLEK